MTHLTHFLQLGRSRFSLWADPDGFDPAEHALGSKMTRKRRTCAVRGVPESVPTPRAVHVCSCGVVRRRGDQPIFYPVLNEEYATKIARDWNVKASGVGYVTRFEVEKDYLSRYDMQQIQGQTILE